MPPRYELHDHGPPSLPATPRLHAACRVEQPSGWITTRFVLQARASSPSVTPIEPPLPAEESSDAQLVRAVAAGDRAALASLYDRYATLVVAIGARILRSRLEAEDIAHDVFLEVWRRAATYDPARASVRTWLVLIMRCRALDRRKSAPVAMTSALLDDRREADPSEAPDLRLDRARVAAALATLSDAQREVIVLGYFEGLSSSEIAERLDIPLGTVKSRVAGALRALRVRLSDDARPDAASEDRSPEDPT